MIHTELQTSQPGSIGRPSPKENKSTSHIKDSACYIRVRMKDTLSIKQIQVDGLYATFILLKILAKVLWKSWHPAS